MTPIQNRHIHRVTPRACERGSALLLSLVLIVVLTFIGFGLLTRSMLVTEIAGAERWSTKTFYAADAGLDVAVARLRVNRMAGFTFNLKDLRGPTGAVSAGNITVTVSDMAQTGPPLPDLGSMMGGGQGSETEPLYTFFYRGESLAQTPLTRSEREVSSIFNIGPMPHPAESGI